MSSRSSFLEKTNSIVLSTTPSNSLTSCDFVVRLVVGQGVEAPAQKIISIAASISGYWLAELQTVYGVC